MFSLKKLLLVVAGIAVVCGGFVQMRRVNEQQQRQKIEDSMRSSIDIMRHTTQGVVRNNATDISIEFGVDPLPATVYTEAAGKPLVSWRLSVFIGINLAWDWNGPPIGNPRPSEPWNSSQNSKFHNNHGTLYCFDSKKPGETNCLAVTGPETALGPTNSHWLKDLDPGTILLIELRDTGINWMEPRDVTLDELEQQWRLPPSDRRLGTLPNYFHVAFADGEVWCLRNDIPWSVIQDFFTVAGAKQVDRDVALQPYRRPE